MYICCSRLDDELPIDDYSIIADLFIPQLVKYLNRTIEKSWHLKKNYITITVFIDDNSPPIPATNRSTRYIVPTKKAQSLLPLIFGFGFKESIQHFHGPYMDPLLGKRRKTREKLQCFIQLPPRFLRVPLHLECRMHV